MNLLSKLIVIAGIIFATTGSMQAAKRARAKWSDWQTARRQQSLAAEAEKSRLDALNKQKEAEELAKQKAAAAQAAGAPGTTMTVVPDASKDADKTGSNEKESSAVKRTRNLKHNHPHEKDSVQKLPYTKKQFNQLNCYTQECITAINSTEQKPLSAQFSNLYNFVREVATRAGININLVLNLKAASISVDLPSIGVNEEACILRPDTTQQNIVVPEEYPVAEIVTTNRSRHENMAMYTLRVGVGTSALILQANTTQQDIEVTIAYELAKIITANQCRRGDMAMNALSKGGQVICMANFVFNIIQELRRTVPSHFQISGLLIPVLGCVIFKLMHKLLMPLIRRHHELDLYRTASQLRGSPDVIKFLENTAQKMRALCNRGILTALEGNTQIDDPLLRVAYLNGDTTVDIVTAKTMPCMKRFLQHLNNFKVRRLVDITSPMPHIQDKIAAAQNPNPYISTKSMVLCGYFLVCCIFAYRFLNDLGIRLS